MYTLELLRRSLIVAFIAHILPAAARHDGLQTNGDMFTEGATLHASCSLTHNHTHAHRPAAKVTWYVGDSPAKPRPCSNPPATWRSPSTTPQWSFCMEVTREHHGRPLRCIMEDPTLKQPINITKRIIVKYVDLSLDSSSYNLGDKVTATCTVSNSLRTNISWYVDGAYVKSATNATMSYDTRLEKVVAEYRAYVTDVEDNETEIRCQAEVDGLRPLLKSAKILNVKYPPSEVTLRLDKEKEYQVGDLLNASCVVRSNPVANVTWFFDDDVIQINEQYYSTVNNWTVTTGFTKRLARSDDGKTVQCQVYYGRNHSSSYIRIRVGARYENITSLYFESLIVVLGVTTLIVLHYACALLAPIFFQCCRLLCRQRGASASQRNARVNLCLASAKSQENIYEVCACPMARRPLPTLPTDITSRYSSLILTNDVALRYGGPNLPSGIATQCREYEDTEYLLPRPRDPVEYLRVLPDPIHHQVPADPKT